jgi:hypothetical protein
VGLSAAATLELWEAAQSASRVERPLVLAGGEEVGDLPLGRRDARLLELHVALVGPALEATASCPACGEAAEFSVDVSALLARADSGVEPAPVEVDGFVVEWRSPDSRDLAAAAEAGDAEAAEAVLLERCVTSVRGVELPASVRDAVSAAMAEADPLAEVLADVECPACGSSFVADLDVGDFVWSEVRAHARRLLCDVAALARAYGWTEDEVLALGERRREAYLELTEAAL